MYIKKLTVHGFKSYRDETIFGPFSPHHNVIVGRNGSGKSNFFAAIRFVLHDAYTKLGQEERQTLLHEGGAFHLSAFVEIIFDNGDGRFPTGKETTVIRRTVGLKKDEYSLDGKATNKTDIMNLLQAAGFSKSNPYYIVPQGRVTALTNAKDAERLALLKEVAGTRTYEEHRQESLRILEETSSKREKIRELLAFIEERMSELEEERAELREYQEKEKERRTLEYIVQHRELVEVGEELERLENEHAELVGENTSTLAAFDDLVSQISSFESQLTTTRDRLKRLEDELKIEEEQRGTLLQEKVKLSLSADELEQRSNTEQLEMQSIERKLEKINADIIFKEDALASLIPNLKAAETSRDELQSKINEMEGRRDVLLAKQGRSAQFRSAAERDRWIKKEIETREGGYNFHEKQLANLSDELTTAEIKLTDLNKLINDLSQTESNLNGDLLKIDEDLQGLRKRRDVLTEQRKELWRAENKLESSMGTLKEEVGRYERALMGSTEKGSMQGIATAKRIAETLGLQGVYGALYELFEIDEVYRTATEVIAGNSLFHVVVDNEHTASRLLEVMVKEKSGRVTFMPLNRLRSSTVNFPMDRNEALPLIEQLRFNHRFEPAFKQVFGKAIVCRDLTKGAAIAREMSLTAITLKGDRADKRGALSGGYIDGGSSKLDLASKYKVCSHRLVEHQKLLADVKVKLREIEPQINRIIGDIETIECRRNELKNTNISELELRRREVSALYELFNVKSKTKRSLETQMSILKAEISSLISELGTPLALQLSKEEQLELREIARHIDNNRGGLNQLTVQTIQMSSEVTSLENELDVNLRRHRHTLTVRLSNISSIDSLKASAQARRELEIINSDLESCENNRTKLVEEIKTLSADVINIQSTLDQARVNHDTVMRTNTDKHASMEKYLIRRMTLIDRKETLQRRIRELAVCTDALYESLRILNGPSLLKKLHGINEELRSRFAHVNKKAHEQHAGFNKQGDALRERQAELEASAKAIDEFIKVLDRRKDEAIERTFQQVASGFSEVFERLIPTGRGQLVMIREGDIGAERSIDGMDVDESILLDFAGVAIRVSFNSKVDEGLLMSQLSGGQKSLVALALILAIQRCDPAPFYLFDEIDANLDAAYRTSVAQLIAEMKSSAQFITTTFRPELLENAELFWGVSFGGRVSRVEAITREQALQFVESDPIIKA